MLKTGKLDSEVLKRIIFDNIKFKRDEIITRPGIGEDCAEIDFGEYICVMSTDPITASVSDIGRLSIHISCNDIASNGVQPVGIMLAVMLPAGTTEEDIETIMKQAAAAAELMEVEIIGGHTEITPAVNKPVIVSTAIGRQPKNKIKQEIKTGDKIFITKYCGIEGTGIIACDCRDEVKSILTSEELDEAEAMLDMVSVVKEGVIAGDIGVSAMHDITEGGVLGAVWELCQVAGLGAEINIADIPVKPVTQKICAHFDIDYLRLISSGCMLIIAPQEKQQELESRIDMIKCIGEVKPAEFGVMMITDKGAEAIAPPESDELYKAVK